ncbi:hypothetical protein ACWKSP_26325 [Micromonosporaceae bacterium Da 78-11]
MTRNDPFAVAELLAPIPDEHATTDDWVRHYAAQALAAWTVFRRSLGDPEERVFLGHLALIGTASTATAVALSEPQDTAAHLLWSLTPEAGALNGEWEEWIVAKLDDLGINPADINDEYIAGDFRSPSGAEAVTAR